MYIYIYIKTHKFVCPFFAQQDLFGHKLKRKIGYKIPKVLHRPNWTVNHHPPWKLFSVTPPIPPRQAEVGMSHRVKVVLGPAKPGNDQSAYLFSLFLTNDFFLEVLLPLPPALPRVACSSFGKGEVLALRNCWWNTRAWGVNFRFVSARVVMPLSIYILAVLADCHLPWIRRRSSWPWRWK